MKTFFITYVVIGLILSIITRLEDDKRVISEPGSTFLFVVFWPYIVWKLASRVARLRLFGRVVWERK